MYPSVHTDALESAHLAAALQVPIFLPDLAWVLSRLLGTLLAAHLLRRLKQLGFTDYFFHSAEHTRL